MSTKPEFKSLSTMSFEPSPQPYKTMRTPFRGFQPVPEEFPYLSGVHTRTSVDDMRMIRAAMGEYKGNALEIGSACGGTTLVLAEVCMGRVYCIDPWSYKAYPFEEFATNISKAGYSDRIYPIRMKSADALPLLLEDKIRFDLCYVDGLHSIPVCTYEIGMCYKLLNPGGCLFVHDIGDTCPQLAEGITKYMSEHEDEWDVVHNPYPANKGIHFDKASSLLHAVRK